MPYSERGENVSKDKPDFHEIDDLQSLLKDVPADGGDFSIDDILNEFGAQPSGPSRASQIDVPVDIPNPLEELKNLTESIQRLTAAPAPDEYETQPLPELERTIPLNTQPVRSVPQPPAAAQPTTPLPVQPEQTPRAEPAVVSPAADALNPHSVNASVPQAPTPVPPPPPPPEEFFGPKQDFSSAFAPSDAYIKEAEPSEDHADKTPRKPLGEALREGIRSRRKTKPQRPSLPVQEAAARLRPYVRILTIRSLIVFALCVPMLLITFAPTLGWSLPSAFTYARSPYVYLMIISIVQIACMFLAIDILAVGLQDILRLRPGMESLLLISCTATLMQVISLVVFNGWIGYMPYCVCNVLGIAFALWGRRQQMEANRRAYKAVAASAEPMMVYKEDNRWQEKSCYTKGEGTTDDFVQRSELPDLAQRFAGFLTPLVLIASLMAALLGSVGKGHGENFFWAFSAITTAATPFVSSLVFSLPYVRVARRLAASGSALAGWTAARMFDEEASAVLTDTDIFPMGTVTLGGLKVFGTYSFDRVTSYAISLAAASGSGLLRVFEELSQNSRDGIRQVNSFQHHEGGIGGEIAGDRILLGTANFLISMGVRLSKNLIVKNAIYVAVNSDLAGIFAINYAGAKSVSNAFVLLSRQKIPQLLAVRDFNITLQMVTGRYKNADEAMLHYPVAEERLALSETAHDPFVRPLAAVTREGLEPFAECIAGGIRLRKVAKLNLALYAASAVIGLLLSFYLTFITASSTPSAASLLSPGNLSLFLLLWCVPTALVSGLADRY